jgi:hypothetical protein
MEEHYTQEDTQDIALEGVQPLMNSLQYHFAQMAPEFFTGKVHINSHAGMVMNVAFRDGAEPTLSEGQFSTWKYFDDEYPCRVIRRKRIFIKGVFVVLFVVQLKE